MANQPVHAAWERDFEKIKHVARFEQTRNPTVQVFFSLDRSSDQSSNLFEYEDSAPMPGIPSLSLTATGRVGRLTYMRNVIEGFMLISDLYQKPHHDESVVAATHVASLPLYKRCSKVCIIGDVVAHMGLRTDLPAATLDGTLFAEFCWLEGVRIDPFRSTSFKKVRTLPTNHYEALPVPLDEVSLCTNPMYAIVDVSAFRKRIASLAPEFPVPDGRPSFLDDIFDVPTVNGRACWGEIYSRAAEYVNQNPGDPTSDRMNKFIQEQFQNVFTYWFKTRLEFQKTAFLRGLGVSDEEWTIDHINNFIYLMLARDLNIRNRIVQLVDELFPVYNAYNKAAFKKLLKFESYAR